MSKEISRINREEDLDLRLNREDIFLSHEHFAFTAFGSCLYGLLVVHRGAIREALENKASEMRLKQMRGEETEQKYQDVEKIWGRRIPRDEATSNDLTEQLTTIIKEHITLLASGSSLTKR